MHTTPDLNFFFAVHRKMRTDTARYAEAVATSTAADRAGRLEPLARWAKGFVHELTEHHYAEDTFFFPDLRSKVPAAASVLDALQADHHAIDDILERWPDVAERLASPKVPFGPARDEAIELADGLRDLLVRHLEIEDRDVLPLFWRHYSAAEYDALQLRAVKKGKKAGLAFVAPWSVECLAPAERPAFIAAAPVPMRLLWRATRRRYERLVAAAFDGVPAGSSADRLSD